MTTTEPQHSRGRPTLLDEQRAQIIEQAVRAGNYLKVAAQWAGVSERSLMSWLARGRAALAAVEQHDPDRIYCPDCDLDRTDRQRAIDDHNALVDAEPDAPGEQAHIGYAVLGRCPTCSSTDPPRPWSLPDAEGRYLQFLQEVTRAENAAEVAAVTAWRSAFDDDWRAARDWLTHGRARDRWMRTTHVTLAPEEAERRIDAALDEALAAAAADTGPDLDPALAADLADAIDDDHYDEGRPE